MNSTSIPASRKVCAFQTSEKKPRSSPNLRGWRIFTSAISVVSTCIVTYVPYHPYYPDLLNNIAELPGDIKLTPPVPQVFLPRSRRSEEHTSELQSRENLVCRLLLEKKKAQ